MKIYLTLCIIIIKIRLVREDWKWLSLDKRATKTSVQICTLIYCKIPTYKNNKCAGLFTKFTAYSSDAFKDQRTQVGKRNDVSSTIIAMRGIRYVMYDNGLLLSFLEAVNLTKPRPLDAWSTIEVSIRILFFLYHSK